MVEKLSRAELKKLTTGERIEYDRQMNNARMRRYREKHKDEKSYKDYNKLYTNLYRLQHRERYLILNRKHNKTYREKLKKSKELTGL
jgi:hypothetical protein